MRKLRNILKLLTCCIFLPTTYLCGSVGSFAGDTIPPVFLDVPQDLSLACDEDDTGIQFLTWYQLAGSAIAVDNGDTVTVEATISLQEALQILNDSDPTCVEGGSVSVGFYGIDSCSNSSLDTLVATFSIIDTVAPVIVSDPQDRTVTCNSAADDILAAWILVMAEAELEDNCMNDIFVTYVWMDNNGNSGISSLSEPVDIPITRESCEWFVDVVFTASDGCGNLTDFSARFIVEDNEVPGFFPELEDQFVDCTGQIPEASEVDAIDACDGILDYVISEVNTQDPDTTNCGHFNYTIERTFTAEDICGNIGTTVQTVTVQDTTRPILVFQDTIILDCETFNANDPDNFLDFYEDLCSDVLVTFNQTDVEINLCDFTVSRTWSVRDRCSNVATGTQIILVEKTNAPSLDTPSEDLEIPCDTTASYDAVLQSWLADFGGASVSSTCSVINSFAALPGSYEIDDPNTYPGIEVNSFVLDSCSGFSDGQAHSVAVDFVFYDECGNATVTSAQANVIDDEAPQFIDICSDTLVFQIFDTCSTEVILNHPSISDNCGELESPKVLEITNEITSTSPGDVGAIVDSMLFRFDPVDISNILPGGEFLINVELDNIDGDDPFERFEIKDENGIVLDTTPNTFNQCGDTSLVISNISLGVFSFWALDGVVDIWVVPIGAGALAVNDVCLESFVTVSLSYEIDVTSNVELSYSLDQGPLIPLEIGNELALTLDAGFYELEYIATDCGNNVGSCSKFINIKDTSPPSINCPSDITIPVQNEATCQASYFFSDTITVFDDCGLSSGDSLRYFIEGATEVPLTSIEGNLDFTLLSGGLSTCYMIAYDASGNTDTCSFDILVQDTISPNAFCQDLTLQIHPGVIDGISVSVEDVDNGSEDLCGNLSFELSDTLLSCNLLSGTTEVQLIVTDASGNTDECTSSITLEPITLDPQVSFGMCNGDTLYLLSNLADSLLGFNYTFEWSGPGNFQSDLENPVIINASMLNEGVYNLEITGEGGCSASGSVNFNFDSVETIELSSDASVYCENDAVTLTTEEVSGVQSYVWFEGLPPNGVQLTETNTSELSIFPGNGMHTYYVQLDFGFCLSSASNTVELTVQEPPVAEIATPDTLVCTGEDLIIESQDPIPGVDYEWYKQGVLISNDENLELNDIVLSDGGEYKLIAKLGPCVSDSTRILVSVITGFDQPIISGENIYCEGSTITLFVNNEPNGEIYSWMLNGQPFLSTASNTIMINNASPAFSGEWQVSTRNFNCESDTSAVFEISVEEEIEVGASNDGPGCVGDFVTLTGTFLPGASFTWTAPDDSEYSGQEVVVPAIEGLYDLLVTTAAGCESMASTFVEVNEAPTVTAVSNTSLSCMNLGDTINFVASVFPPGDYDYEWTGPNNFMSSDSVAMVVDFDLMNNGSYTLTVFNENCPSNLGMTTVDVSLIPPKVSINLLDGFCEGDILRLESSDTFTGATYIWNTPSGEIETNDPVLVLPSNGLQIDGFYTLSISQNGCISELSDTLIVQLAEMPNNPEIIGESFVCAGEDLLLTSDEIAESYIWTGLVDIVTTEPELLLTDLTDGGQITLSLQNGDCASEETDVLDIIIVSIPDVPQTNISNVPDCVMPNETIEICIDNYNSNYTYFALNEDEEGIAIFDTPCFMVENNIFENGANIISIFSEINGCRSEALDTIIINAVQQDFTGAVIAQDDYVICDNDEQLLNVVSLPPGGMIEWSSLDDDLILVPQDDQVFVSNVQDGDNVIIVSTSIGSCTDLFTDTIIITSLSEVLANDDIIQIEANESRTINIIDNDVFGQDISIAIIGQPVEGQAFLDDEQIIYIPPSGYFGEVTIIYEICELACPNFCSRAVLEIQVGDPSNCMVPTVITPNGDGVNDALVIPCLDTGDYLNNQIIIFNQWGDEVFSANPYMNDWEGTYSGDDLPVGTYYYILDLADGNRPLNGFIIIER